MTAIRDTAVLTGRSLRHILRSPDTIITTAITPIARSATLWAHVLTSLAANLAALVLVVGSALLMGFRTGASVLDWLAITGVLVLFTLALTWVAVIAVIAGLSAKSVEGASALSYPLIFLPFISSAFVPTETMPGPVRWFAEHQPVTSIVDTIRALFAGTPIGSEIRVALAWCAGVLALAWIAAIAVHRKRFA
ncbi:ABC transporter permease [Brevibacterium samyangense]|uniref:ABC-2 type transporter transmembrane domain-containing protein n=1 Tax=Brevibacterium samyangense TaxID=366888 RepID=A0ABN2TFR3_9MICO